MALSYDALARRRLLDPRASSTTAARGWPRAARRTTTCCTRCSTSRRRSIRGSTSRTGSARSSSPSRTRAAPGRPDLAIALLEKGFRADPAQLGVPAGHRLRLLLVAAATTERRPSGSRRRADMPGAPWWLQSLAAVDARAGRRPRQSSRAAVAGASASRPTTTGCARTPSGGWRSSMRSTQIDQLQAIVGRLTRADGHVPGDRGTRLVRARLPARVPRRSRPARRTCSTRRPGVVPLSADSPLCPLPAEPQSTPRPLAECPMLACCVAALFGLVIGSFLNVCIYRLPRGQSIVWPPSRCPRCGRALALVRQHPGPRATLVLRGRCRTCRAPICRAVSDRRAA